jgi:hypothetical protein
MEPEELQREKKVALGLLRLGAWGLLFHCRVRYLTDSTGSGEARDEAR